MNAIQSAKVEELRKRLATERGIVAPLIVTENSDGSVVVLVNHSGHVTIRVRGGMDLPNVRSFLETGVYPNTAMGAAVHADELESRCLNGYRIRQPTQTGSSSQARATCFGNQGLGKTADPYKFMLQFDASAIDGLVARRLTNVDEQKAFRAGANIAAGNYTRVNLKVIIDWKIEARFLSRVMSYLDKNTNSQIENSLRFAIATSNERWAVETLDELHGIGVPVATAVLTTINPEKYTIIDVNALKSLGVKDGPTNDVRYYLAYLRKCRELAQQLKRSLRTLDHALWQWGHEH